MLSLTGTSTRPCGPQDLKGTLAQELDFENEGRNAERCARDLQHFHYIVVPRVYWDVSSKRVLTAEFCEGCKVNDVEAIKSMGLAVPDVSAARTGSRRAVPAARGGTPV